MKTSIIITGQIGGNHTLRNAIIDSNLEESEESGMFFSKTISFSTKKDAKKALWEAYKLLRRDIETKTVTSYRKGDALFYDASKAEIYNEKIN